MFDFPGPTRYPVVPRGPDGKAEAEIILIRIILGLSPIHDTVAAVRVLHEQGRAALENILNASATADSPEGVNK